MGSSLLFRLPQELRDLIYEYALYEPQGLIYQTSNEGAGKIYKRSISRPRKTFIDRLRRRSPHPNLLGAHGIENNQLKYVCRRLYLETRNMDLRLNCIVFRDCVSLSAVQQSALLFRRCPLLRKVAIMSSPRSFSADYGQDNLSSLIEYCTANPAVMVRVHIPFWSQANPNFILLGLSYLSTLRGDASLMARLAQRTSVSFLSDSVSALLTTTVEIPPNFRFYPCEESFDLDALRRDLQRGTMLSLSDTQAAIGDVRKLVEQWFYNGL